ncbi:MAG: hypothetical protein CMJ66_01675 [Planctomycetaceae bacterium]|nr:hypothetical protein [Planctomycetaceae bacterium]
MKFISASRPSAPQKVVSYFIDTISTARFPPQDVNRMHVTKPCIHCVSIVGTDNLTPCPNFLPDQHSFTR